MTKNISNTQIRILELLRTSISQGKSPSLRKMANLLGLGSANSVLYHIQKLEQSGHVVRNKSGKVIRVNTPDEATGGIALLPLLGNAKCGKPLDQIVDDITYKMIPVPLGIVGRSLRRALFLVRAVGESMTPMVEDGDLVIFEPSQVAESGKIVVARTQEGFVIKLLKETPNQIVLQSVNRAFGDLVFEKNKEGKAFNIDGVAIGIFRNLEREDRK